MRDTLAKRASPAKAGSGGGLVARVVVLLALAAAAFGAYHWYFSDERAVRSRLNELADTLSMPANTSDIARVTRLAGLRRYFSDAVHVRFGGQEVTSRDALVALLGRWTPPPGGVTVEFVDVQVTLDPAGVGAQVYLTAKATGRDARTGDPTIDAHEANVTMAKRDGDWVVSNVESEETLQKP